MASEVLRGEEATARSDIWALGVLLYEMASGQLPFGGASVVEVTAGILKESPFSLATRVSPGLRAITQRSLTKEPGQRYASAGELRAALEAIASSGSGDVERSAVEHPASSASIAVLPFTDMSPQRDQDYFCEGMADEIINVLTGIKGLRVAARTSSFTFRGQVVDATEIGTRLKVDSVLEGSVRKAGDRLRITTQLINVADGLHLWSDRYDRELDDVFAVQEEIARSIADRLNVALGKDVGAPVVTPPTQNIEAYNAYLRRRFALNLKGGATAQALEYFQRAVSLDSTFALAHAGVADAYVFLGDQGMVDPTEAHRKAKAAVTRALNLDLNLVDAHVTLAWMHMLYDWDRPSAERHYLRALEIGPFSADAHSRYGCYLGWMRRRYDDAVVEARKGVELDPMNATPYTWLGCILWFAGRSEEAIEVLRRAVDLDRTSFHAHFHLGVAVRLSSRYQEAIDVQHTAMQLGGRHPWSLAELGYAYVASGDTARAQACHEEMVSLSGRFTAWAHLAGLSAALGKMDEAFEFLERAYERREVWMVLLAINPQLESMRTDPRFDEMVRRVGIQ